jgi:predicted HTH domain antitoxin
MSIVITDEILQTIKMSDKELIQKIAILLFEQEPTRITIAICT